MLEEEFIAKYFIIELKELISLNVEIMQKEENYNERTATQAEQI